MAKKKKPAVKTGKSQEGTPTLALLPARKYHFTVLDDEFKITIPREGKYSELAPEIFNEEEGAFNLLDTEFNVMYLPAISKVLFATSQYPDLENGQLFCPMMFMFNKDTVDVVGQVIQILPRQEPT